ncbi:Flagellar assembly factor FliW [compost metagenome]
MNVTTLFFGELQVEEKDVITFTQGMPGFEELTKYTMIKPDESLPFIYFQSMEEGGLSFLMTNPFQFFGDYDFELSTSIQEELKIQDQTDISVWTVVTVNDDFSKASVNLMAPVVLNQKENLAKQIILHDSEYQIKHELILNTSDETNEAKG